MQTLASSLNTSWLRGKRESLLRSARFYFQRQNWRKALEEYKKLAWHFPKEAYFLEQLAFCYQNLGDIETSDKLFLKALDLYEKK